MEQHITALGQDGFNMNIDILYKIYVIEQRIKSLHGKKQLIIDGTPMDSSTQEDIDTQIQVLTNMLEML
jgi:hypothetical protein